MANCVWSRVEGGHSGLLIGSGHGEMSDKRWDGGRKQDWSR